VFSFVSVHKYKALRLSILMLLLHKMQPALTQFIVTVVSYVYCQEESAAHHTVEIQGDFLNRMKHDHRIHWNTDKEIK